MKKARLLPLLAAALIFSSCAGQSAVSENTVFADGGYVFEDIDGRVVTLQNEPAAVLASDSALLHLWQLSGGAGALIQTRRQLSGCELLLLSPNDSEWLAAAEQSSISAGVFSPDDLDGYLFALKIFTDINGRPELYEYYGSEMAEDIAALVGLCGSLEKVNVCLVDENFDEAGQSFITDMLKEIANYTPESEAQVVFVAPGAAAAMGGENYVYLNEELFSQFPMERLGEAYGYLAEALYELN